MQVNIESGHLFHRAAATTAFDSIPLAFWEGGLVLAFEGKKNQTRVASVKYTFVRSVSKTPQTVDGLRLRLDGFGAVAGQVSSIQSPDAIDFELPKATNLVADASSGIRSMVASPA